MVLMDCHTHTQFSVDSEADINACAEQAARLGLDAYAITDHCECDAWYPAEHYSPEEVAMLESTDYAADYEASVAAVTALKEKYDGRLNLLCGSELGQILFDMEAAQKVCSDKRVDFIIGSVHRVRGEKDFYFIDYTERSMDDLLYLLGRYFMEVYEMSKTGLFDVVGHLTYSLRYMKQRHGICPDISVFDDIIAETFRTLVRNGKGIEINTSGLRQGFGSTFPDLRYVKLYRELGGEILTIGSDSHTVEDIGAGIADGIELAKAAGFRYLTYFRERRANFVRIGD